MYKPGSFEPVAQVADGQVQHIHTDHLGTPRELSNGQGQWVWKARYRTYGALALQEEAVEEQNPSACKLRFQGQYWDEESGLHYNLNRYHDPQTGQFISQDPIGLAGGLNLYQYAPNPVTWVDPWGLSSKDGCQLQLYWPPNRGFIGAPSKGSLLEGYEISRYGGFVDESGVFHDFGTFVAPRDVPYPMRALPPGTDQKPFSVYRVVKEIHNVPSGPAASYFGEIGGGIQHELPMPIEKLIESGHVELLQRSFFGK
nr:RHS repeat-associated core domain-containing protein [Limnobacter humi]